MSTQFGSIRGKRALIVEEEFYSRWFIRRLLEPYTLCDVVVRGEEAVDSFQISMESGTPYELVLLDIRLPEMSGDAVLREIRAIEKAASGNGSHRTKVILLMPDGEVHALSDQILEQCEGMIPKPIVKGELLSQLKSLGVISA